jgi:hypothetical protein
MDGNGTAKQFGYWAGSDPTDSGWVFRVESAAEAELRAYEFNASVMAGQDCPERWRLGVTTVIRRKVPDAAPQRSAGPVQETPREVGHEQAVHRVVTPVQDLWRPTTDLGGQIVQSDVFHRRSKGS